MNTKMEVHPRTISRISHHARARGVDGAGLERVGLGDGIVRLGSGEDVVVGFGTETRSERQTPSPGTTLLEEVQLEETQDPDLRT